MKPAELFVRCLKNEGASNAYAERLPRCGKFTRSQTCFSFLQFRKSLDNAEYFL